MGFGNGPAAARRGRDPSQRWVRRLPMRVNLRGGAIKHPVAATVHEAKWCAQRNRYLEATGEPNLNAQSPFERWDGDCALSHSKPVASDTIREVGASKGPYGQSPDRYRTAPPTAFRRA